MCFIYWSHQILQADNKLAIYGYIAVIFLLDLAFLFLSLFRSLSLLASPVRCKNNWYCLDLSCTFLRIKGYIILNWTYRTLLASHVTTIYHRRTRHPRIRMLTFYLIRLTFYFFYFTLHRPSSCTISSIHFKLYFIKILYIFIHS